MVRTGFCAEAMLFRPLQVKKATNDDAHLNVLCPRVKVSRNNEDVKMGKRELEVSRMKQISNAGEN